MAIAEYKSAGKIVALKGELYQPVTEKWDSESSGHSSFVCKIL